MWPMIQALRFATGRDDVLDAGSWALLAPIGVGLGLVWLAVGASSALLPNPLVAGALVLVVDAALVSPHAVAAPTVLLERPGSAATARDRGAGAVLGLVLLMRLAALLAVVQPVRLPFLLLVVPVLGRLGGTVFAAVLPPSQPGLERPSGSSVVVATAIAALVGAGVARAPGLAVGGVCLLVGLGLGALWRERRLPADARAVRAAIVLVETCALVALNAVVELGGG